MGLPTFYEEYNCNNCSPEQIREKINYWGSQALSRSSNFGFSTKSMSTLASLVTKQAATSSCRIR